MTPNKNTLSWRVEKLEMKVDKMDVKVESIMENHLPSIKEQMSEIKTRQTINLVLNAGAIILLAILGIFAKYL